MITSPPPISPAARAVQALIFAATAPLGVRELAGALGDDWPAAAVRAALAELADYHRGTGIELVERGGAYLMQTPADLAHLLRPVREEVRRLSRAASEVLAIIAYHEPVSRAEIEAIRGVQTAKGTLDVLMEAGWIVPAGRREAPGRPLIYQTTPSFLVHFGLSSRKDLPGVEDLRAAGLLDPVDLALEAALDGGGDNSDDDAPELVNPAEDA